MMARACGKTNVHSLEPEDLAALTMEASAIAMVPLAGYAVHGRPAGDDPLLMYADLFADGSRSRPRTSSALHENRWRTRRAT